MKRTKKPLHVVLDGALDVVDFFTNKYQSWKHNLPKGHPWKIYAKSKSAFLISCPKCKQEGIVADKTVLPPNIVPCEIAKVMES